MRVLVIGAGITGAEVINQLQKNPAITILTADPREKIYAIEKGLIDKVDFREALTPLTFEYIVERAKPDLILLTRSTQDMELGTAPGLDILAEAMREELAAISDVPVIRVSKVGS